MSAMTRQMEKIETKKKKKKKKKKERKKERKKDWTTVDRETKMMF